MSVQTEPESLSFQADAAQILDLVVHSLYSNKEIFLRELISNASDAIDRLRLELLAQSQVPEDEGPLEIWVNFDPDAGTITVADNGIGMSRQEVIDHIGTIAKSGTREFLQELSGDERRDAALIGQFGVGFYSAFIVAEQVTLTTRRHDSPAGEGVRWSSDGIGTYTLETIERPERGTTIVLYLREGEDELLNAYLLSSIIQKYSDHISLPIMMSDPGEGPDEEPYDEESEEDPGDEESEEEDGAGGKPGQKGAAGQEPGEQDDEAADEEAHGERPRQFRVNQASALWTRPKTELTKQDYVEFYRHITNDYADPLAYLHSRIEGNYDYTLLLFIPSRAPFDVWSSAPSHGVRLHIRRVFIMEDSGQIMLHYLRFVRGVIDSSDLPLNVSRELLQGSRAVEIIRTNATKKVLRLLSSLADKQPEKYARFWREFGAVLKEGVAEDYSNRDDISRLLRFTSTASANHEPDVSLSDYVARMKEGQEKIYYVLAPSLVTAGSSPHLEAFKKKGIEVLLLADGVDDWVVSSLPEFDGKQLQSVARGATDFGALENEAEKTASKKASAELAGLVGRLKEALGAKVFDVRVTSRLTNSPACIVANEPEADVTLALWAQGSGLPARPVLEINPEHPLVERLHHEPDDPHFDDWAHVLYNQAVLTLGARIDDPAAFVGQLNNLLVALSQPGAPATRRREPPAQYDEPPAEPDEELDDAFEEEPPEEGPAEPAEEPRKPTRRAASKHGTLRLN
jgi:molecular chaperone HtpG